MTDSKKQDQRHAQSTVLDGMDAEVKKKMFNWLSWPLGISLCFMMIGLNGGIIITKWIDHKIYKDQMEFFVAVLQRQENFGSGRNVGAKIDGVNLRIYEIERQNLRLAGWACEHSKGLAGCD